MENETQKKQDDAKAFIELIQKTRENSNLHHLLSVALQSYTDGLQAAARCLHFAQANHQLK